MRIAPAPCLALIPLVAAVAGRSLWTPVAAQSSVLACAAERPMPLVPTDPAICGGLEAAVRAPGARPLGDYEARLGEYLRNFCYRDEAAGWTRDKRVRDTGPFTAELDGGRWHGTYRGTHAPVLVWYSPEMSAWMRENRPAVGPAPDDPAPIPDGAIMIKEMYPAPAAACGSVDPLHLLPTSGAAVMVRDATAAKDGWFWGWFGWSGWDPDWPAAVGNRYPNMGFGQYCVNCHASAADNLTFASLRNVRGQPGEPLVFLSQHFFDDVAPTHHRLVSLATDDAPRLGQPRYTYDPAVAAAVHPSTRPLPSWETVTSLPSETYDNVWVPGDGPTAASEFVTSDQCLGCHDAGSTGLQFDMTAPNPHATSEGTGPGAPLLNLSPYATWRTSPMGLGGRDPVFYAQLASETQTFHPESAARIETTCLGCHGVLGQRQHAIDRFEVTGACEPFPANLTLAVPWPDGNPSAADARYGALARDGISCTACHRMAVSRAAAARAAGRPENRCVSARQAFLNPDNTGFARTFTGSFFVGPPNEIYGPFADPKVKPMETALGFTPTATDDIRSSELCGTCHTVHLPVMHRGRILRYTYEQTTYAEWAFSAYRTGATPDGPLPSGAGGRAESCQTCHMPSRDAATGAPVPSKIASIQERSTFPEVENGLGAEDIDLPVREGFARHTLVGLNVFLVKMMQQFPDVLGIRTQDPMLVSRGVDPLLLTEQAMLDQASRQTATIAIDTVAVNGAALEAKVTVTNETGHKFPSGVGFRRAFIAFSVLDEQGGVLWASGRTNRAGVIVDDRGAPVAGERWWTDDCSARLNPDHLEYQPHYQQVTSQRQAQIYQELVTAPAEVAAPQCGAAPTPGGLLTTSFLSICGEVKDNRLLPSGFLPIAERVAIAGALGAGPDLAEDTGPHEVGNDPEYRTGGGDSVVYRVDLSEIKGTPAAVTATLYYQATPPFFLQDRLCTSRGEASERLGFLAGHVNLDGTDAEGWKLEVVATGAVPVGGR